ncbi:hypothetical protein ACIQVK_21440 [Streptomyces sp. NPDC090493]|uniref:hypothetical protein n=1 Tax=Streptomyces sp. NPDC090493 TaxID=3365964 RepID=UPI0037F8AD8B
MDDNDVMLRAIGILTQGKDGLTTIRSEGAAPGGMSDTVAKLVADLFPDRMPSAISTGIAELVVAFVYLHSELAELHDSGRTDITSEELLRKLALEFSTPPDDNG